MSNPTTSARILDARGLEPPAPMTLTLEALDDLPPGGTLDLILNREPVPLYGILARNGYRHRTEVRGDGAFVIHIESA